MPRTPAAYCPARIPFLRFWSRVCGQLYPGGATYCPACLTPRRIVRFPRPARIPHIDIAMEALRMCVERANHRIGQEYFTVDGLLSDAKEMRLLGCAYQRAERDTPDTSL